MIMSSFDPSDRAEVISEFMGGQMRILRTEVLTVPSSGKGPRHIPCKGQDRAYDMLDQERHKYRTIEGMDRGGDQWFPPS